MSELIEALEIFLKYGNPKRPTHCEHDVMYVQIPYDDVADDDRDRLRALGFVRDSENDMFKSYRFGSA